MLNNNEKSNIANKFLSLAWKEIKGIDSNNLEELDKKIKTITILIKLSSELNLDSTDCKNKMTDYLMSLIRRKKNIYEEYSSEIDIVNNKLQMVL